MGKFIIPAVILVIAACCVLLLLLFRNSKHKQNAYWDEHSFKSNTTMLNNRLAQLQKHQQSHLYCAICFSIGSISRYSLHHKEELDSMYSAFFDLMRQNLRPADFAARISESEIVLLRMSADTAATRDWAYAICRQFHGLCQQGTVLIPEASLRAGITEIEDDSTSDHILQSIRYACEIAFQKKQDVVISDESQRGQKEQNRMLLQDLRTAMKKHELVYHIQPFVEAATDHIIGGEALVRWMHPTYGLLMPGSFISLFEEQGLITELDFYCLNAICEQLEELKKRDLNKMHISCNFSRSTLSQPYFLKQFKSIIESHDFNHDQLVTEITESMLLDTEAVAIENINEIKKMGIQTALDDFGSGYTSFKEMVTFHVDYIKLDISILHMANTTAGRRVLDGLIQFGHSLGCCVLSEGAETKEQIDLLKEKSCDWIQGFYYYRPMPFQRIIEMLEFEKKQGTN